MPICFSRSLFIIITQGEDLIFIAGSEISVFPENHFSVEVSQQIVAIFYLIIGQIDVIVKKHLSKTSIYKIPIIRLIGKGCCPLHPKIHISMDEHGAVRSHKYPDVEIKFLCSKEFVGINVLDERFSIKLIPYVVVNFSIQQGF